MSKKKRKPLSMKKAEKDVLNYHKRFTKKPTPDDFHRTASIRAQHLRLHLVRLDEMVSDFIQHGYKVQIDFNSTQFDPIEDSDYTDEDFRSVIRISKSI